MADYYISNKPKRLEYQHKYYEKNRDKLLLYAKNYQKKKNRQKDENCVEYYKKKHPMMSTEEIRNNIELLKKQEIEQKLNYQRQYRENILNNKQKKFYRTWKNPLGQEPIFEIKQTKIIVEFD